MTVATRIAGAAALGAIMATGLGLAAPPAEAAYTVTLEQVGPNVVATGSGTIDLIDLSFVRSTIYFAEVSPNEGIIATGPAVPALPSVDLYTGITGPASFGTGGVTRASSGRGGFVAINLQFLMSPVVMVPERYSSGGPLSDTATYDGQTFTSLGVTPGSYVWSWGSGTDADSFTLDIPGSAVPGPSAALLLAVPLGLVIPLAARHRRRGSPAAKTLP